MDEEGAEVLDDEDGAPRDLDAYIPRCVSRCSGVVVLRRTGVFVERKKRTEVLDEDHLRARDVDILEDLGIPVLERLARRGVEQADAVEVREARRARHDGLYGVNRRVGRDLDGLGEPADRPLWGCCFVSMGLQGGVEVEGCGGRREGKDGRERWVGGSIGYGVDVQRFWSVRVTAAILKMRDVELGVELGAGVAELWEILGEKH